jgi:hypothetical protein
LDRLPSTVSFGVSLHEQRDEVTDRPTFEPGVLVVDHPYHLVCGDHRVHVNKAVAELI